MIVLGSTFPRNRSLLAAKAFVGTNPALSYPSKGLGGAGSPKLPEFET